MKLGLAPIGSGTVSVWLTDGTDAIGPSGLTQASQVDLQARRLFRATDGRPKDRGNRFRTLSFTATRLFASQALADAFMASHEAELEGDWDLEMETDAGVPIATMTDVVVQAVQMTHVGVSVRIAYTLVGGALTPAP